MNFSVFETIMLVCFGFSWPMSIAKALRTKVVRGKSPFFLALILVGYVAGMTHKVLYAPGDPVVWLYAVNFLLVATDLSLYIAYRKNIYSKSP